MHYGAIKVCQITENKMKLHTNDLIDNYRIMKLQVTLKEMIEY